jgi:hypothetical protein
MYPPAGMVWHFDLSCMLGWANANSSEPSQRGCWLTHRGSSEAAPGSWAHPTPVGMIPGSDQSSKAIYILPESRHGAFFASGWTGCRLCDADATAWDQDCQELDINGPDILSPLFNDAELLDGHGEGTHGSFENRVWAAAARRGYDAVLTDTLRTERGYSGDVVGGNEPVQDAESRGGMACLCDVSSNCPQAASIREWKAGDVLFREGKMHVTEKQVSFGINLYKLQHPCEL